MLTPQQEASLVSQGDCFEHYHSADRVMTHATLEQLDSLESAREIGAGSYTLDSGIDYLLVDTTLGGALITIPPASKKMSVTIVKVAAANTVTVQAASGNINGAATYVLSAAYASAKLKAINGNYYKVA